MKVQILEWFQKVFHLLSMANAFLTAFKTSKMHPEWHILIDQVVLNMHWFECYVIAIVVA